MLNEGVMIIHLIARLIKKNLKNFKLYILKMSQYFPKPH